MRRLAALLALLAAAPARAIDGVWQSADVKFDALTAVTDVGVSPGGAVSIFVKTYPGFNGMALANWNGTGWSFEPIVPGVFASGLHMELGADGRPHVLYLSGGQLSYAFRGLGGWTTEPVGIYNSGALAVDSQNNPHIVARAGVTSYYIRKASGAWTATSFLSSTNECDIILTPLDQVVTACINASDPHHLTIRRWTGSAFSSVATLVNTRLNAATLGVGPNGKVHVAYITASTRAAYARIDLTTGVEAAWTAPDYGFVNVTLAMDGDAPVLAVAGGSGGLILTEDGAGGFTPDFWAAGNSNVLSLAMDPAGKPYVLGSLGSAPTLWAKLTAGSTPGVAQRSANSINWALHHAPASAATGHRFRRASDQADLSGLLPAAAAAWPQTGLPINAPQSLLLDTYMPGFVVRSSGAFYTSAAAPRDLSVTRGTGGSFSALWTANGNPAGTQYRLRFRTAPGGLLTETLTAQNIFLPGVLSAPMALTLEAISGDGEATPHAALSSFTNVGNVWTARYELMNGDGAEMEITGPAGASSLVLSAGPLDVFPSGRLLAQMTPLGRGFLAQTGQELPAGVIARGRFIYPVAAFDAYDPADVLLARFDAGRGAWIPLATGHDVLNRTLSATLDGFGPLQVMVRGNVIQDLGNTAVYPSPFRPGAGPLTVREIPAGAEVKVLSVTGRVVRSLPTGPAVLQWDGLDDRGARVRSGVYTVEVKGAGGERRFRILVEN